MYATVEGGGQNQLVKPVEMESESFHQARIVDEMTETKTMEMAEVQHDLQKVDGHVLEAT